MRRHKRRQHNEYEWIIALLGVLAVLAMAATGCAGEASAEVVDEDGYRHLGPGVYNLTLPYDENEIQFRHGDENDDYRKWELEGGGFSRYGSWRAWGGSVGHLPPGDYVLTLFYATRMRTRKMGGRYR